MEKQMEKQSEKPDNASPALPAQPGLAHRSGLAPDVNTLFPHAGLFEAIGGSAVIATFVDRLYDRFETDPLLRPAFGRDLQQERGKVKLFFEAWFGGSPSYFEAGWRTGLRTAHDRISISRGMAIRWVEHFLAAFSETVPDSSLRRQIEPLVTRLAQALVNRTEEPDAGESLRRSCHRPVPNFLQSIRRDDAAGIESAAAEYPEVLPVHGAKLLLTAAMRGKAQAAEALLRYGVEANAVAMLPGDEATAAGLPMLYITPLCAALAKRRDAVATLLVAHGAHYDIFTAAFLGDSGTVQELLDQNPTLTNANDPACDLARITPLTHAVFAGQFETAQLLLTRGATVEPNSVRLIRAAANAGQEVLVDLLLPYGANPTTIGAGSWVEYPAIANKLLTRGANVNAEPGVWIGLCCTGNSGHTENATLARALLRCGADMTARYKGRTGLHCAAKAGFAQVAEALIASGAEVNALDARGRTPLDALEEAGKSIRKEPVRRLLLAHGAMHSPDIARVALPPEPTSY